MRLLACGCLHGKVHRKLKKTAERCDAVLCAGDLSDTDILRKIEFDTWAGRRNYTKKSLQEALKISVKSMKFPVKFLNSLDVPVFLVAGNSDFLRKEVGNKGLEEIIGKNVTLLKSRIARFGNIYIAGFSYYRGYSEKKYDKNKVFDKRLGNLFSRIKYPRRTFLLMHEVPYGIFDLVKLKSSPAYGEHVGDPIINKNLKKKKLLAHICAHMHEYQGMKILHSTPIITTGYGRFGKHVIIELDGSMNLEFVK